VTLRPLLALLRQFSWAEWRHQPGRTLVAVLAVALGVALALSVQLINASALQEFGAAVRSVDGQPDLQLRASGSAFGGRFDEALFARVAQHPQVALASAVIELEVQALRVNRADAIAEPATTSAASASSTTRATASSRAPATNAVISLRLLGLDALVAPQLNPELAPVPDQADADGGLVVLQPDALFLNDAARQQLGLAVGDTVQLRTPEAHATFTLRGRIAAVGPPLAVIDIAGAQQALARLGSISRIDVRLQPGATREAVLATLALPPGVRAAAPDESAQRLGNVSRAYRVNLTVLALVALFTGGFLVFSILSLSVARRLPQLALLGVLGLSARQRLVLVMAESAALGLVGSALGVALGTGLAALALRLLAGDLGGGYFAGISPQLQFDALAALAFGLLGVAAAMAGGWLPARQAQQLPPAQGLKGLGASSSAAAWPWTGPALLVAGVALSLLPPIGELPIAAYVGVAALLLGGIACVPASVALLLRAVKPPRSPLALLAVQRARHQRHAASTTVAGVVASLALSVALTVMVSSFRDAVTQWLDTLLPADLYLRIHTEGGGEPPTLPPALVAAAAQVPGVQRVNTQRVVMLQLDPARPAVALIARPMDDDPARSLPMAEGGLPTLGPVPAGAVPAWVSEAVQTLYGAQPGQLLKLPLPADSRTGRTTLTVQVRGIWRDYARQHGAIVVTASDWQAATGDAQVNDLALWLHSGSNTGTVQAALRTAATRVGGDGAALQFASPGEIRLMSLRIFDRSFAVTYWLQAVAIGIGQFGIAASFSAQVLARRKEFGLLTHLGLSRRQVLTVVTAEGAVWTAAGTLVGLLLGLAVAVVLVKVVNPQSFHWTMPITLPVGRLAALCGAVLLAGTVTTAIAARRATGASSVQAVKEEH
jgi:putative ABC transport system permease protein